MTNPQPYRSPPRLVKKPRTWGSAKGLLLYLLPLLAIPATIKAFINSNLTGIIINATGYALYLLAVNLLRRGIAVENQYNGKKISLAPKWPLKTIAALITAVSTFMLAWLGAKHSFGVSTAFGIGALLGMYLSYGFDPRKNKTILGNHGYSTEEIITSIDAAAKIISRIEVANSKIRNDEFNQRIERICTTAHSILVDLEANPAAIRRTRKFLLVYLEGTDKVTSGYANTHLLTSDATELEQNFRNVLDSIEKVFNDQKEKLLQEDLFDLDVQIEVLTTQLKSEGVI